ncbi:MAG: DUF2171 domain-containing protein [Candidatus Limnocylindrales bacterium]
MSDGRLHRSTEAARSSVVRARSRPRRVFGAAEIEHGWLVVDVDGENVGRVEGLEGEFLTVSRGFGHTRLYVPLPGVREVTEGTVRLNLTRASIDVSHWSEKPRGNR